MCSRYPGWGIAAIHGVTVENTLYQDLNNKYFQALTALRKKPIQWLLKPFGLRSLVLRLAIRGGCISLCLFLFGLWTSSSVLLVLLSTLCLWLCIKNEEDLVETFYTKNFLNEVFVHGWHLSINRMKTLYFLKRYCQEAMLCDILGGLTPPFFMEINSMKDF